jgi:DnaK suppressor protein
MPKKAQTASTEKADVPEREVAQGPVAVGSKGQTAPARRQAASRARSKAKDKDNKDKVSDFFAEQRRLLLEERESCVRAAESLKAQADSLALEHEPGDVQFDEEGGEGGTANVDREIDLQLSAQARATIAEIDKALERIEKGTYGICESCNQPIPEARLQALPYATLCVACKSGGLSSRR